MDSLARELSSIVLNEKPTNLKVMSEELGKEEFLNYLKNIELFYHAITGISGHTYLGASTFDFVTYDRHRAEGRDPLWNMKSARREIPERNKMSKDDWDRHRLVGEMINIVEDSQKRGDDSSLAKFVHDLYILSENISSAFGSAYTWAGWKGTPWEQALDSATYFFEARYYDVPEKYARTKSYFDHLEPKTQHAITAWLGEVFYKTASTRGQNIYIFSEGKDGKRITHHSFIKLPEFSESVESYCKRRRREKRKKDLRFDYFLEVGDKVLQSLRLERRSYYLENTPARPTFIERVCEYLPNKAP